VPQATFPPPTGSTVTVPPDASFRHVYHLSPARLVIFPVMWVAGVALCAMALFGSDDPITPATFRMLLILVGGVTVFILPFFGLMWQSRLVLTPEGIAHHQFGYTVRSAWEHLDHLDLTPGVQHVVLAAPGTRSRLLSMSVTALDAAAPGFASGLVGNKQAYSQGRLIGLAPFMTHWKRGPLRDDLLRWAPHLFDAAGQPRRPTG
jgi:hypothetical protein